MIENTWYAAFRQLDVFTQELEKVKSYAALDQVKPVWRILKSVQLKYVPTPNAEAAKRLEQIMARLSIREVAPSAFTLGEAVTLLTQFTESCGVDPDQFETAEAV
jgi:hypothetical protein